MVPLISVCDSINTATPSLTIGSNLASIIFLAPLFRDALEKSQLIGRGVLSIKEQSTAFHEDKPPFSINICLVTDLYTAGTITYSVLASLTKLVFVIVLYSGSVLMVFVEGLLIIIFLT